jgi:hypothetical protein
MTMSTSVNSISFVITAIYTGTFANSVYQLLQFNDKVADIQFRSDIDLPRLLCALICMVMTIRFFFGNNNYVDSIFATPQSATRRLYHFATIVGQSLILLGCSYLIRNPAKFDMWIAILFATEIAWYAGCLVFLRDAISDEIGRLLRPLAFNELANVLMALGAFLSTKVAFHDPNSATYGVAALFAMNRAIDLGVNLKAYMGATS